MSTESNSSTDNSKKNKKQYKTQKTNNPATIMIKIIIIIVLNEAIGISIFSSLHDGKLMYKDGIENKIKIYYK